MARTTLIDVARHCGVSRATVSLVLNDSPLVADQTAKRVRQAMSELGYVYNRAAAALRTQRSDAVGVVMTQLTNPYFAEFAAGLQDVLTHSGTVPLLALKELFDASLAATIAALDGAQHTAAALTLERTSDEFTRRLRLANIR